MNVSALDVVKEALRLYPPTRRIYRHLGGDRLLGADLEKVHRAEPLAPIDPLQFRLERWSDIEKQWEATEGEQMSKRSLKKYEASLSFIPFGSSNSVIPLCPAGGGDTQGFGFEMIAVLVGTMIEGFGKRGWDLRSQDSATLPHLDTLLRSERDDYGGLQLARKC